MSYATADKVNGRPVKKNGYSFAKQRARRDRRRQEAEKRADYLGTLNLKERLNLVNSRRGASAREWERLTGEQLKSGADRALFNLRPFTPARNA